MKQFLESVRFKLMVKDYHYKKEIKNDSMKLKDMYKKCKNEKLKSELLITYIVLRNYRIGER